jgi:hypothetical protein
MRKQSFSVQACRRRLSSIRVFPYKSFFYGILYGRTGRLTSKNGDFWRGQRQTLVCSENTLRKPWS